MSFAPRLLPLVGVAIGGALALRLLTGAQIGPALFDATAVAAPVSPPTKRAQLSVAPAATSRPPPPPSAPAPVCARSPAELARDAGLSPAELQTLQNLGKRRGQLDARESALDSQLALINAASIKLDARLKGLADLKSQIQGLLGQADARTAEETDKLVIVYEKMKPRDAGALMATLDDRVRVPVAARIAETKPAIMAAILSQMGTLEGKKLTELLAHRFQPNTTLVQAMASGAAAAAAAAAAPPTNASALTDTASPPPPPPRPRAARLTKASARKPVHRPARAKASEAAAAADPSPATAAAAGTKPA